MTVTIHLDESAGHCARRFDCFHARLLRSARCRPLCVDLEYSNSGV